jgi:PKD repeat protein
VRGVVPLLVTVALGLVVSSLPVGPRAPSEEGPSIGVSAAGRGIAGLSPAAHASGALPALDQPRWRNLTGPVGPPDVVGRLATDPSAGAVLWWGAVGPASLTWEFEGGVWTNRTSSTAPAPPGGTDAVLSSDPARDGVVWVGGSDSGQELTWLFSNGSWANVTGGVGAGPPARAFAGATWDPASDSVVLVGGWNGTAYLGDTWLLSSSGWGQAAGPGPTPRAAPGLAYDGGAAGVLLVGGATADGAVNDTWSYANGSWTGPLPGPWVGAGSGPGLAEGPGGGVIAEGGLGCGSPAVGPCNLTFARNGTSWTEYDAGFGPSPRTGLSLAYDPSDGVLLGWGGRADGVRVNDTWAMGGEVTTALAIVPPVVGVGEPTELQAVTAGGYGPLSFSWANGPLDCPTGPTRSIDCESDLPGLYNVSVTVEDLAGNVSIATSALTVLALFTSVLEVQPTVVDTGEEVTLTVEVVGGAAVTGYAWTGLPPGCPGESAAVLRCAPLDPGFYAPVATATDALGHVAPSPPAGLLVHAAPTLIVGANASEGVAPMDVGFSVGVVGGTAPFVFAWQFGDGGTATGPSPTHAYTHNGSYAVEVEVTDATNATANASLGGGLTVVDRLTAGPVTFPSADEVGLALTFSTRVAGGLPPYTYRWTFGDGGEGGGASPQHTYSSAGTYSVTVLVTDAGGQVAGALAAVNVSAGPAGTAPSDPWPALGLAAGGAVIGGVAVYLALRVHPRDPPAATSARAPVRPTDGTGADLANPDASPRPSSPGPPGSSR